MSLLASLDFYSRRYKAHGDNDDVDDRIRPAGLRLSGGVPAVTFNLFLNYWRMLDAFGYHSPAPCYCATSVQNSLFQPPARVSIAL